MPKLEDIGKNKTIKNLIDKVNNPSLAFLNEQKEIVEKDYNKVLSELKALQEKMLVIVNKKESLEVELDKINRAKKIFSEEETPEQKYQTDWSWKEKVGFVLKELHKFSSTVTVSHKLRELEPELRENRSVTASVKVTLARMVQSGTVVEVEVGGDLLYGLSDWKDKNGNIMTVYIEH